MEKKRKKGKKGLAIGAAGGALAAILLLGGGLGLGSGTGEGETAVPAMSRELATAAPAPAVTPEAATPVPEPAAIRIEICQDRYYVDGAEITLSQIEALIGEQDSEAATFILEDNYASAKAWDEIKALFARHEVGVVER